MNDCLKDLGYLKFDPLPLRDHDLWKVEYARYRRIGAYFKGQVDKNA